MDYTKNYHLPQWAKEDRIMMEDFNEMCAGIETGLTSVQAAADTARSDAAEAAKLPYVVGSYTGEGKDMEIRLGFRPSFVIVSGLKMEGSAVTTDYGHYLVMTAGNIVQSRITFTDNGFTVFGRNTGYWFPDLTFKGRAYDYIAFR